MRYTVLLLALAAFIFSSSARAQDWQPFRPGQTYHFTQSGAVDSLFNFRVTAGPLMAGDSAWEFQPLALPVPQGSGVCGIFRMRPDNQFGHWIVRRAGGLYEFLTDSAGGFQLYTQAADGQSWNFGAGLQATQLGRGIRDVVPGVPDSVKFILLSNGGFIQDTISLSQHYGLLRTTAFMAYVDSTFPSRSLTFFSLPEQGVGRAPITFQSVFDFQPGDKFQRWFSIDLYTSATTQDTEGWIQDSIISRTTSGPDTIIYTMLREKFEQTMGGWGSQQYTPPALYTEVYTSDYAPQTLLMSQGFDVPPLSSGSAAYPAYESGYFQRFQMTALDVQSPFSCPNYLYHPMVAWPVSYKFAEGLGYTYFLSDNPQWNTTLNELTAYSKGGGERYGTFINLSLLATAKDQEKKELSVFPNPVNGELNLQLPEGILHNAYVKLIDALGKVVWLGAASQDMQLQMKGLPKGIYILSVTDKSNVWHIKVVKE